MKREGVIATGLPVGVRWQNCRGNEACVYGGIIGANQHFTSYHFTIILCGGGAGYVRAAPRQQVWTLLIIDARGCDGM